MTERPELSEIQFVSPIDEINSENDNVDVHIKLNDGRSFALVVATPNNIFECMANEGNEYFFGVPVLFVRLLDRQHVEEAVKALISEENGKWLSVYGVLQEE